MLPLDWEREAPPPSTAAIELPPLSLLKPPVYPLLVHESGLEVVPKMVAGAWRVGTCPAARDEERGGRLGKHDRSLAARLCYNF
jgi:hypothetical protein